ncbi:MAG: ETC complex I subunit [Rickettsiales bacterium]|nr:ETC complex I subunit [Rickettsiales bacterium]
MQVTIYQAAKNSMQSGMKSTRQWRMRMESDDSSFIEPLMGWVGSKDTRAQVDLQFATLQEAEEYARRKGYDYVVKHHKKHMIPPKSYADNFRTNKVTT